MAFRSSWLQAVQSGGQRFAAGIDIGSQAVRVVVVSQRARAHGVLHLEHLSTVQLMAGAMAGTEIADRQTVARALRDAFASLPRACATHALRCAMAVPAAATLTTIARKTVDLRWPDSNRR
jgi:Tfp pilus assembly PilM family ATPase